MKIIFFGTSDFAKTILGKLMDTTHEVVSVVTKPTPSKGRGMKSIPDLVELLAKDRNLKILQFDNVNSDDAISELKSFNADIFIVVSYGQILKESVLSIPKLYSVNIHASLLPKYRGASPIQYALLNGDKETGITIIRMDETLDGGDIILQKEIKIDSNDYIENLSSKLSLLGSEAIIEFLNMQESKRIDFKKQDNNNVSYAPKIKKEDGLINWSKKSYEIVNQIRALSPWPSAYTHFNNKILKILQADTSKDSSEILGEVILSDDTGIKVACSDGSIVIKKLQLEGKKALSVDQFLRGNKIEVRLILK